MWPVAADVAWSVCLSVCVCLYVCWKQSWALQEQLNRSRCLWVVDSGETKEPWIRLSIDNCFGPAPDLSGKSADPSRERGYFGDYFPLKCSDCTSSNSSQQICPEWQHVTAKVRLHKGLTRGGGGDDMQTWNWVTFCDPATQWVDPVTRESSDPETQLTWWPCSIMKLQMSTYVADKRLQWARGLPVFIAVWRLHASGK